MYGTLYKYLVREFDFGVVGRAGSIPSSELLYVKVLELTAETTFRQRRVAECDGSRKM